MSFLSTILKQGSHSVVSGLVGAIGAFTASVIVARLLGVEGTATVAMAMWLVFLSTTISDVGISGTLARYSAECPTNDEGQAARLLAAYLFRSMLKATAAGLLLTALVLWVYWNDIEAKYSSSPREALTLGLLILLCFVVHMLSAFAFSFLRGTRSFGALTLYALLGTCLQVSGVLAGSLFYGANGALAGYIISSMPVLLGIRKVRFFGPFEPLPAADRMRRYAVSYYLAVLFSPLLWVRADLLIVDQALGAVAVGLFAAAGTIAALLLQVCQMVCSALLPNIVHAAAEDRSRFDQASRIAVRLALVLLMPACLIAAAAAPEAITIVFGPDFAGGGTAAIILCLAGVGSAFTLIVASVISAGDSNAVLARNGAVGAVVTIVSGSLLALWLGLVGAALGRLLSQGIMGFLNVRSANRRVPGLVTIGWLVRILTAALLGAVTTEGVGRWLGVSLPALFLSLALGGFVYLLAASLLLPLDEGERERLLARLHGLPRPVAQPVRWLLTVGRSPLA